LDGKKPVELVLSRSWLAVVTTRPSSSRRAGVKARNAGVSARASIEDCLAEVGPWPKYQQGLAFVDQIRVARGC
jgi:hypothetical protein